jgi:hypothetical protein
MGRPTIFYILENETLNSFWVGRITTIEDCPFRSITQDKLNERLYNKYTDMNPYLTLVTLNKNWNACYGVERWLSKLDYKINKEPEKYKEVKNLLMAGWDGGETSTLSVMHILRENQPINDFYKRLVSERESKGMRCLNTIKFETRSERYQRQKCEPDFLKHISREKVLKTMEKTKKLPKPETLAKYDIKEDELREIMGPKGIIYKITSPSGKVYVGQTIQEFKHRIRSHQRKDSKCTLLKRAIQKYGDEMKYEIVEEDVPQEHLDEREIYWINELHSLAPNGYNLNTGGNYKKEITKEAKNNVQNGMNKAKILRDGYLGSVYKQNNLFKPIVFRDGKKRYLSSGAFLTREEAVEILKEYTKCPDNFLKTEGTFKRGVGSVYKNKNKWAANYKKCYLGSYNTKMEAEEALEKYIKDPKDFPSSKRNIGNISKQGNRWKFRYKHKHIGSYATREEAEEARQALQSS